MLTGRAIGKAHYQQMLAYAEEAEREGWHYGNQAQFEKRHEQIVRFLKEATEKCEKPRKAPGDVLSIVVAYSRRMWLLRNPPACPECAEDQQIQLTDWSAIPADWKCRKCKRKFQHEPGVESC